MKDYYATLKVQQGPMKAAMLENGIATGAELSRKSGVPQTVISALLNFRQSPRNSDGTWSKGALAVARVLVMEPSEIFPDHLDQTTATNTISAFVDGKSLGCSRTHNAIGTSEEYDYAEMTEAVNAAMQSLDKREKLVLHELFWNETNQKDIASRINRTPLRVSQCTRQILQRLRRNVHLCALDGTCALGSSLNRK